MLKIRNATKEDAENMYVIECETYGTHHWSKKSFINELINDYSKYFICEEINLEERKLIGFAGYWIVDNEGHITTMVVSPNYRKKGVADILLYTLISSALAFKIKWLTLEVRVSNIPAIKLYSKYNFKQLGIRKNYYQNNKEDALILWTDNITSPEYINFLNNHFTLIKNKNPTADILQYTNSH